MLWRNILVLWHVVLKEPHFVTERYAQKLLNEWANTPILKSQCTPIHYRNT